MAATAPAPAGRWLYGPVPDLLIGCGLWYALALIGFSFAGESIRTAGAMSVLPFAMLLFGTPHYGATLLRVYQRSADRRRYTLFTVHATIVLALLFAFGVHNAWLGSLIVTVYVTWSPWHYSGQNYGLAVMFLRRRGVALDAITKRWLYASFVLSYLLTLLALHGGGDASHYAPVTADPVNYRFLSLGLPAIFSTVVLPAVCAAYIISLGVSAWRLLRRASPRDLVPTAALTGLQALWFSIPLLMRNFQIDQSIEPWTSSYGTYYFLWIAIAHSIQYIWITSYYERAESGSWSGKLPYFMKTLLAGALIWTVPTLLFAPGVLGRLPYDGGFAVLVASIVNLHHFVLDGAIWKLRDGRVARILLRDQPSEPAAATESSRWGAPLVWGVGAICLVIMFSSKWAQEISIPRASAAGDVSRVREVVGRLAWVGRDSAKLRRVLGDTLQSRKDIAGAIREYRRANEIRPTVSTWYEISLLHAGQKHWRQAADALESALVINPDEESVLYQLGLAHLQMDDYARARSAFERAANVNPDRAIYRTMADRAVRRSEAAAPDLAPQPHSPPGLRSDDS